MDVICNFCPESAVDLRKRTVRGNAVQYVWQCLGCGEPVGSAVAKAAVLELRGTLDVMPFDAGLAAAVRGRARLAAEQAEADRKAAWFEWYGNYLTSDAWLAKRDRVFKRAGGVCEGCGDRAPDQVHHLSYENVGAEFLFQLVAICEPCHQRYHAAQDARSAGVDRFAIPERSDD